MYDDYNGWLVSEFESAEIPKSPSKVTEAILEIAEQKPFYGIESVENNRIVILTTFNSEVSKTVICVTLQPSEDSTRVHASTVSTTNTQHRQETQAFQENSLLKSSSISV